MGYREIYKRCTEPKEANRQMGPMFRNWLKSGALGLFPVPENSFIGNADNAILDGSDSSMMDFARRNFGYGRDKGLDFIARYNGRYVIGEAKFISLVEASLLNRRWIGVDRSKAAIETIRKNLKANLREASPPNF